MESRTWFLLMVSVIMPLAAVATDTKTVVVDMDGHPLRAGGEYYVLPVIRGRGGRLTLKMRNNSCPMYVAQERLETSHGLPVVFRQSTGTEHMTIEEGVDLKVEMAAQTVCAQSTTWTIKTDSETGKVFVGAMSGSSLFKIEKQGNDYVLVFCPQVCDTCRPICDTLGTYVDQHSNRWLVVGSPALPVQFKKV